MKISQIFSVRTSRAIKQFASSVTWFFIVWNLFFTSFFAQAQNLTGISSSNYSGANGLYQNPSSIADSRYKLNINLFTADVFAGNNFIRYNAPTPLLALARRKYNGESLSGYADGLEAKFNGDRKFFSLGADVRGPSVSYRINDKNSIALTTRARSSFQLNNMSEAIARILLYGSNAPDLQDLEFYRKRFDLSIHTFGELGFSYATVIADQGSNFLKAGVSIKKMAGLYAARLNTDELTYHIEQNPEDPEDNRVEIAGMKGSIAYVGQHEASNFIKIQNWISGKGLSGSGFGFDFGLSYEFRPDRKAYTYLMDGKGMTDPNMNKYKYRIGLSFLDLGSIKYKGDDVLAYPIKVHNTSFSSKELMSNNSNQEVAEAIKEILEPNAFESSFKSRLPASLNLNVDYKIRNHIYINTLWMPSLVGKQTSGMRHNSLLAVAPRFEMKYFEFSLPLSLNNNYQNFALGAMLRLGTFFIGSDHLGGLLNFGKPQGANIYSGVSIPLFKGKLKDKDMDGISDKKDLCPDVPGLASMHGCPDTDMDGVPDHLDECPYEFGVKQNNGCPQVEKVGDYKVIQLSKEEKRIVDQTFENLAFESGKTEITEGSFQSLEKLALLLKRRQGYRLLIEGHSDNIGSEQINYSISLARAEAVKKYLVEKGIASNALLTAGYGSQYPLVANETEEGRKRNRRVEFKFVQ